MDTLYIWCRQPQLNVGEKMTKQMFFPNKIFLRLHQLAHIWRGTIQWIDEPTVVEKIIIDV